MTQASSGSASLVGGASSSSITVTRSGALRSGIAMIILAVIIAGAYSLHSTQGRGASASFSLLTGAALGIVFQRGRFCFFCIIRDYIEHRNSGPLFAIVTALAVGAVGYAVVFGAFLPNAMAGRLPPDAHIGPVSWVTLAAGLAFGLGMALSGACISGHLYRLGEGYSRAPIALIGSIGGFALGFLMWQNLYISTITHAPVAWLPATFGYGGSLALHLALLSIISLLLLRRLPAFKPSEGGQLTPRVIWNTIFGQRWNPLITGGIVGAIGVFSYFRVEPLGVTAQLGSVARTILANNGILEGRLPGLDTFAGCATMVVETITDNGLLIGALVLGSLSMALFSNKFSISRLTLINSFTALLGGALMGWGAMLALGCTVGTLLSGISAFAISGWVFGAAVFIGVWVGIKLRLHRWG